MSITVGVSIFVILSLAFWLLSRWSDRRNRVEVYTPQDDARQYSRLEPYFRREVVERKIKSLFPNQDHAAILKLLDIDPPFDSQPLERAQLNILKVSNGDLEELKRFVALAESDSDYMRVNKMAECPESSTVDINDKDLFWGEHKRIIERDFRQYLNWLKKK
jgi:hypothetical protein